MSQRSPDQEPSVLDYVKSRFAFWKPGPRLELPPLEGEHFPSEAVESETPVQALHSVPLREVETARPREPIHLPNLALASLALALLAQFTLEPRLDRSWLIGAALYLLSAGALLAAWRQNEWCLPDQFEQSPLFLDIPLRTLPVLVAIASGALAFALFGGGKFNLLNVTAWLLAIASLAAAFWKIPQGSLGLLQERWASLIRQEWSIKVPRAVLALGLTTAVIIYMRTANLGVTPSEMISDHAEKLVDINGILNGQTPVYFARNIGSEFIQNYLTAWFINLFNTGLTFISLKAVTVLCGLLTLPFVYLLARDLSSRRAGLIAAAFAGIAYWPNALSRTGLNFTLYPFFLAPALYFFLLGLKFNTPEHEKAETANLNNFILAGLCLGLGMNGYSAFQIVPVLFLFGAAFYFVHQRSKLALTTTLTGFLIMLCMALLVCLPLLRYAMDNPQAFIILAQYRVGVPFPAFAGNGFLIFFQNLVRALGLFAWDNGDMWLFSISHRPALDIISAALFNLGALLLALRYVRQRCWQDLFWLAAIPILILPSVLSLANPAENPGLDRAAGALIPAFLLVGLALDSLMTAVEKRMQSGGKQTAAFLCTALFLIASLQNYALVFKQYDAIYTQSAWNTTEIGSVVRSFANLTGSPETAWLVAYPFWVDSRLVMINAGYPERDNAMLPEKIDSTAADPRAKLFILNPQDQNDLSVLHSLYPLGWLQTYTSSQQNKDFWLYFVPADLNQPGQSAPKP